mgnify:CR=1 FL=1
MALFESYERRINQVNAVLNKYGISSLEEAKKICGQSNQYVLKMPAGRMLPELRLL